VPGPPPPGPMCPMLRAGGRRFAFGALRGRGGGDGQGEGGRIRLLVRPEGASRRPPPPPHRGGGILGAPCTAATHGIVVGGEGGRKGLHS